MANSAQTISTPNGNGKAVVTAAASTRSDGRVFDRRLLNRLVRDLATIAGCAVADLAAKPRKAPQWRKQRLLYRRADQLTDADLDQLVSEIGAARLLQSVDRLTRPTNQLAAAA